MRVVPADIFTTAMAREAGWSDSALLCAVRAGRLTRLRRGVYACAASEDPLQLARAAALAYPGAPLSHLSAARAHGIPVVGRHRTIPELTVPPRSNADIPGAHPYRARVREHELTQVEGTLVLTPARTVIDLARHYRLVTAVVALDHVLHHGLASAEEVLDVMDFCRTWPGGARARRALALCDSRAESPLESVSRLAIVRLGLGPCEPQVIILDPQGQFIARCDFYWERFGVVGEADGLAKYTDGTTMEAQNDRQDGLDDTGLVITRWGWRRVWREPDTFGDRTRRAFERGLARERAGIPRQWQAVTTPRLDVA